MRGPRVLVAVGLLGLAAFVAGMVAAHVGHSIPFARHMSSFAHGPASEWWVVALVGMGLACYSLAAGLWALLPANPMAQWGLRCLAMAGFMPAVLLVSPTDRTWTPDAATSLPGLLHDTAAVCMVVLVCSAAFLVALARDPRWRNASPLGFAWPAACTLLTGAWLFEEIMGNGGVSGILQRLLLAVMVAWLATLAMRALRGAPDRVDGDAASQASEGSPGAPSDAHKKVFPLS